MLQYRWSATTGGSAVLARCFPKGYDWSNDRSCEGEPGIRAGCFLDRTSLVVSIGYVATMSKGGWHVHLSSECL